MSEVTWKEIFQRWREREGIRSEWQRCAREKGFETWEEWRKAWVANFDAENRTWERYMITDPIHTVSRFRVGPSQTWQQQFPENEKNRHSFADVVKQEWVSKNDKVREILTNFPTDTELIGVLLNDETIVLIEGHHRAAALAIMASKKMVAVEGLSVTIGLTEFGQSEEQLLDVMLARGSSK